MEKVEWLVDLARLVVLAGLEVYHLGCKEAVSGA